jgi:hypothetical protein
VLIGVFTLAHLWTHATAPYDKPAAWKGSVLSWCPDQRASEHQDEHDDEHHDHQVHSEEFVLPAAWWAPVVQQPVTLVAVMAPRTPARAFPTSPTGRSPPRDHRGRAALTHTLEVYRS